MTMFRLSVLAALVLAVVCQAAPVAAEPKADLLGSLKEGEVTLKSSGPLAFGPQGILFIGDPAAAKLYAIDTGDRDATAGKDSPKVDDVAGKIASLLGTEASAIKVNDIAVNPTSGNTYLAVARSGSPVVLKVTPTGKITEVSLKKAKNASTTIPNPGKREAITHIAYVNGRVLVSGLSSEKFASNLRAIPFPFDKTNKGTSVEIFHGAHGKLETHAPVRVFAPYKIDGKDHILAAYMCTPLVKLPLSDLEPGKKVTGTTVAELGNRNRPLAMIVYNKGGKDYVLMANSSRGLMKIKLEGVDKIEAITKRVEGGGTAGLTYAKLKDIEGVQKLDAFGKTEAVLLVSAGGKLALKTIALP
jgi:hypothetical protein